MIFDDIIQQILSTRKDLDIQEIIEMIEKKERQGKGFLTRESAARATALELGVETEKGILEPDIPVSSLVSNLNNVTVKGRVVYISSLRRFNRQDRNEGSLRRIVLADETGDVAVTLWDDRAENFRTEELADRMVRISHAYVRRGLEGSLELNVGTRGEIVPMPNLLERDYPTLAQYTKRIGELSTIEQKVNIAGLIEDVYPLRIFKRQDKTEGKVRRLGLRDTTGQITVVLWNQNAEDVSEKETGKYLAIFDARTKKNQKECVEVHVNNSSIVVVLHKKPSGFVSVN